MDRSLSGSANDASDVVQDTFLRWQSADRKFIETPEAWLTKVLTNVCHIRPPRAVGEDSMNLCQ